MAALNASALSFWKSGLLVFAAVFLLSVPQAALIPLLDRDEPRFAEASREMRESGNWIVPTFNDAPRYAKPPLIYWCQAASFALLGENPFSARLPSLLATAATALLLFWRGRQLGGMAVGLMAGLAYPFCLQTIQQGRVATADALLVFFMTLTILAGGKLLALARGLENLDKTAAQKKRSWIFWGTILALGFGGGFLAKGPEALLPFIPLIIGTRRCGARILLALMAILALGLFIVTWWAVPAYLQTQGDYWRVGLGEDVGSRMVTPFQGHGGSSAGWYLLSLPLYLLTFWLSALPWSPLLLIHRRRLFAGWRPDPVDVYLLLNASLVFLVFSLMVTKLPHYTLPAFPVLALLFARRWGAAGLGQRLPLRLTTGFGLVLAVVTAVVVPVLLLRQATPSPVGELVRAATPTALSPESEFALVDFQEPNAIWEMRAVVHRPAYFIHEPQILDFLRQPGPRAVILSTALWEKFSSGSDPAWKTFRARGWNAARLSSLDLTLVTHQ